MKASRVVSHLTLHDDSVVMQCRMTCTQRLCWNTHSSIDAFGTDIAVLTDYSNLITVFELRAH